MEMAAERQSRGEEIERLFDTEKKTKEDSEGQARAEGEASPRRKVDDVWERKVWFESHQ